MNAANTELSPNRGVPPGAGAPFKALLQPQNRVLLIAVIALAVLIVVSVVAVLSSLQSKSRTGSALVDVAPVKVQSAQSATGMESESYRKAVEDYNTESLEELRNDNPAAHPIPVVDREAEPEELSLDDVLPAKEPPKKSTSSSLDMAPEVKRASGVAGNSDGRRAPPAIMQGDERVHDPEYMKDLVTQWSKMADVQPEELTVVAQPRETGISANQQSEVAEDALVERMVNGQDIKKVIKELVETATLVYGISEIALNTDYMGPVWLSVPGGALAGADLIGSMEKVDEKVRLSLNKMRFKGKDYAINAIALDPSTTYAAVASRVDRHVLYRYGWWGFGTVLSAVGKASLAANQQIAVEDDVVLQGSTMDARDELKVALGELGQEVGDTFKDRISRPITVHVDAGQELGIFFLSAVVESK